MEMGATELDSSGTDDDLPPTHQARVYKGSRVTENGRATVVAYDPRSQNDMESQVHRLEQEAYTSVLRAFKAQSDAITWEKESLITELRKELKVTNEEHRDLLGSVNADDLLKRIWEWRKGGGIQSGLVNASQPAHEALPSPTFSASHKKQKSSRPGPPLSKGGPAPPLRQQNYGVLMRQPASSAAKRRIKKPKSLQGRKISGRSKDSSTGPPSGLSNMPFRGPIDVNMIEADTSDPLVGRKVFTRWPEDNNFYEAIITNFDAAKGVHVLRYDMNTPNESWELVNLKEISPDDIRWEGEDPGISRQSGRVGGIGRGGLSAVPSGGVTRRGAPKPLPRKDGPAPGNITGKRNRDDIEILHTDSLIKEVERVVNSNNPNPGVLDKVKRVLKEQEQSLVDAIAQLADASDGESVDVERDPQFNEGSQTPAGAGAGARDAFESQPQVEV